MSAGAITASMPPMKKLLPALLSTALLLAAAGTAHAGTGTGGTTAPPPTTPGNVTTLPPVYTATDLLLYPGSYIQFRGGYPQHDEFVDLSYLYLGRVTTNAVFVIDRCTKDMGRVIVKVWAVRVSTELTKIQLQQFWLTDPTCAAANPPKHEFLGKVLDLSPSWVLPTEQILYDPAHPSVAAAKVHLQVRGVVA